MTTASDTVDPTVPIGSAIVETLKVAGPRSASGLARRLKLRKTHVLVACRTLAAAGQIRRLGKRWALRPPVRCEGLNKAGRPCARAAAYGSSFCTLHQPDANAPRPGPEPDAPEPTGLLAPLARKPPSLNPRADDEAPTASAAETVALVKPRERAPARSDAEFEPERWVAPDGRPITEADVIEALSMLGDEQVQAYHEGRLPKPKAYTIARDRLRTIARMTAGPVYRSPFRRQW